MSVALHALLLAGSKLPVVTERSLQALEAAPAAVVLQASIAVPKPAVVSIPDPPRFAAAPAKAEPKAVRLSAPLRRPGGPLVTERPPPIANARVVVNTDAGLEPDDTFIRELANHPATVRVALAFVDEPIVNVPLSAVRDSPQRRIRALVIVREDGALELLRTDEYDVPLIEALREALAQARARADDNGHVASGWSIAEFWIDRLGPPPR